MTGRERVTEHVSSGRRYRLREFDSGSFTVERWEVDGWELLDDDQASALVDRLFSGRPDSAAQPPNDPS